jgi:PPE-repeat protein
MDFALLPPEVNSGLMYTGPGAGPMLAAATAWDELAGELYSTAASYESVISGLAYRWQGASSAAMAAAVTPYTGWMSATAAQAEATAMQAKAAVAAYETAFAGTVPPPMVAANRAQLMSLIATNFFGQNTPAIMATEAQYLEMWAQDAAAMYGYAGSSATASQLLPFEAPPQTANPAGTATQAAADAQAATLPQLMSAVPQSLQSLAMPAAAAAPAASATPLQALTAIDKFVTGPLSPGSLFTIGGVPYLLSIQSYLTPQAAANLTRASENFANASAKAAGSVPQMVSSPVLATTGGADMVGGLSVPQGWTMPAPSAVRTVSAALPEAGSPSMIAAEAAAGESAVYGNMAMAGMVGRALALTGGATGQSAGASGAAASEKAATANIFVIPGAVQ